ncbi:hypothetical protein CHU98_g6238 [Xylaria longipes]|nr:hypothetical protein CHU98_g6238 [Xylaria longipes]
MMPKPGPYYVGTVGRSEDRRQADVDGGVGMEKLRRRIPPGLAWTANRQNSKLTKPIRNEGPEKTDWK